MVSFPPDIADFFSYGLTCIYGIFSIEFYRKIVDKWILDLKDPLTNNVFLFLIEKVEDRLVYLDDRIPSKTKGKIDILVNIYT